MRSFFWIFFVTFFAGIVGLFYNGWLGWHLAHDRHLAPEKHLVLGLASLGFVFVGHFALLPHSQALIQKAFLMKLFPQDSPFWKEIAHLRQSTLSKGFVVIGLSLLSLITGTISHAGHLPILHLGGSVVLLIAAIATLFGWIRFKFALIKTF